MPNYFDVYLNSKKRHSVSYERCLEYWLEDSERRIAELKAALRERELWMDAAQKKIKELEEQAKAFVGEDK